MAAFFTSHTWRGNVLHISSIGCEGAVFVKDNYLTARLRFDRFGLANLAPYLKDKVLSEVAAATVEVAGSTPFGSKDIFIIHGHGDAARLQLKTLLSSFGLNPIVLAEMNDGGMTVIEKFEYYARLCSFAVALMTPDDQILGSKDPESQWRARPNVILELGWFMARLGRDRVLLFSQGDLDIPSESVMEVAPQLSCRLRDAGMMWSVSRATPAGRRSSFRGRPSGGTRSRPGRTGLPCPCRSGWSFGWCRRSPSSSGTR